MATIYETIKYWADGQNDLNAAEPNREATLQQVVHQVLVRLQRHTSLADLAVAYYGDNNWWPFVAQEFDLSRSDAHTARNAAYWQRFMQLRHPPKPSR
jgi:hypothetical protein